MLIRVLASSVTSELTDTLPPETAGCAEVVVFVRNDGASGTFAANFDAIFASEPGVAPGAVAAIASLALRRRAARRAG